MNQPNQIGVEDETLQDYEKSLKLSQPWPATIIIMAAS